MAEEVKKTTKTTTTSTTKKTTTTSKPKAEGTTSTKSTTTKKAATSTKKPAETTQNVETATTVEAPKTETKPAKVAATKKASKDSLSLGGTAKREKAKKEEAPAKPTVTEARASALTVKITPRKCRLSCDLVRGKDCYEAVALLSTVRHKSAPIVAKLIKSAVANAVNNFNMNEDKLYVASIMASDSIKMKRYIPRAKGSASGLVKRFCNLYVVVKERN